MRAVQCVQAFFSNFSSSTPLYKNRQLHIVMGVIQNINITILAITEFNIYHGQVGQPHSLSASSSATKLGLLYQTPVISAVTMLLDLELTVALVSRHVGSSLMKLKWLRRVRFMLDLKSRPKHT